MDGGKFDDDDLKSAQKTGRKTADKPSKRQKSKNAHVASQTGGGDNGDDNTPTGLTKNEAMVWDVLKDAGAPLKAYEILDILKSSGVRAPMTVYRALDGLEEKGFVHKIEGMNAFVPCSHNGPHAVQAFFVCEKCPNVVELDIEGVQAGLLPALKKLGFHMHTARLEVSGCCADCNDGGAPCEAAVG